MDYGASDGTPRAPSDRTVQMQLKSVTTFSDAMVSVRRQLWKAAGFCMSSPQADSDENQGRWIQGLSDLLCSAA